MGRPGSAALAAVCVLGLGASGLGACGVAETLGAAPGAGPATADGATSDGATSDGPVGTGGPATSPGPGGSPAPELVRSMDDGVWPVAGVGEVEFALDARGLELVEVRPEPGWRVVDEQTSPGEIEVELRSDTVRASVEVSVSGEVLEVEVDRSYDPLPPGPLDLGDAGTVDLLVGDDGVRLGEVVVGEGWRETARLDLPGEARVDLVRNAPGTVETWEVHARLDDGRLEVDTDHEVQGLVAR